MYERIRRDIAYARGLFEGNDKTLDRKALERLLDAIDELVELSLQVETRVNELEDYVEEVDDDLNELELAVYDDPLEDEEDMLEIVCPNCDEEVLVDEEDLVHHDVEILCPKCSTVLSVDVLDEEDEESSSSSSSSSYSNL